MGARSTTIGSSVVVLSGTRVRAIVPTSCGTPCRSARRALSRTRSRSRKTAAGSSAAFGDGGEERLVERVEVVGPPARDEVGVDVDFLVDPRRACVAQVGLQARPRGQRAA